MSAAPDLKCAWIETVYGWETDCGFMIERFIEPPSESGVFRCLECGREIEEFPESESETGEKHD